MDFETEMYLWESGGERDWHCNVVCGAALKWAWFTQNASRAVAHVHKFLVWEFPSVLCMCEGHTYIIIGAKQSAKFSFCTET